MDSVSPSFPRRSHYHSERPCVPSHFPDRNDRSACARFRLARKRRTYAASPSSCPAAISSEVKLWREVLSLRQQFNELSALMLEQAHNIAALLKLQDNSPPMLPSFLTQHKPPSTAAHSIPESGDATIDIIGDEPAPVAQPLQSTVSDAPIPPLPSATEPPLPIVQASEIPSSTAHSRPRPLRDADIALPKLRGMFNRTRKKDSLS
ncbi:hypothetical protein R3P38DRAFT_3231804 [Favolaschia claudopus]|uniref:Uncharacterized protein n=1 Tax=Favolaschia claudopus TaxID=2862362 RepID=A0AAV9ZK17_9AGAR